MASKGKCFDVLEAETAYLKFMILWWKLYAADNKGIFEVENFYNILDFKPPHRGTKVGEFWLELQDKIWALDQFILSPFEYLGQRPWGLRLKEIAVEEAEKELDELPGKRAILEARIAAVNNEITELQEQLAYYDEILDDPETDYETFWETFDLYIEVQEDLDLKYESLNLLQSELNSLPTTEEAQQAVTDAETELEEFESEELSYRDLTSLLEWLEAPLPFIAGVGDSFRARNKADVADYEYRRLTRGDFLGDWIVEDINTCLDGAEYLRGVPNNYFQDKSSSNREGSTDEFRPVYYIPWCSHYAGDKFYSSGHWEIPIGPTTTSSDTDDIENAQNFNDGMAVINANFNDYLNNVVISIIQQYEEALKAVKTSKDLSEPVVVLDDEGVMTEGCHAEFDAWDATFKLEFATAEAIWDIQAFVRDKVDVLLGDVAESISGNLSVAKRDYTRDDTYTKQFLRPRQKEWLYDSGVPLEDPCPCNYEYIFLSDPDWFYNWLSFESSKDETYYFSTVGNFFSTGLLVREDTYEVDYYVDTTPNPDLHDYDIDKTTDYELLPTVVMANSFSTDYSVSASVETVEEHEASGDNPAYTSRWSKTENYGSAEAQTFLKLTSN